MRAIAWFVSNGVAANLLMLMILFGGALTLLGIKEEIFPETAADRITITVPYPGAAPEEVEEGICVRIEERIQDLEGIKELTSMAAENGGTVSVEVLSGTDARRLLDDIKTRVDAIDTFPEEAEEPVIQEVMIRRQVVNVTVAGGAGERSLRALAERTREEIVALPGITHAELSSARDFEIAIEVSEEALRRHRLSFDEVAARIRRGSLDLPGGSLKTDGGEILLRSKGQAYRRREFEDLVLRARPDGTRVLLGDVAEVIDGFADTDQSARFDGEEAIQIKVFRVGDQSALEIGRRIRAYVREARARLPEGIEIGTWQDFSIYLQDRLDLLKRNAFFGLALVIGVLALFLRLRLALWISVGIVVSFLGTLWLMPILGVSMNMISAFAFIVVLGIVVDDAIVVGENIYRRQQQGETGEAGAISGVKEVAVPVVFAVLTTVTAFSPLLFVPGTTGRIWRVIPMIVIPTLLFSLVESMLILPAHLRHQRRRRELSDMRGPRHFFRAVQTRFTRGLAFFTESIYQRLLGHCLRLRYLTVATFLAIFILTVGFALGGFVRFAFMPDVEADFVVALLTMPEGTPVEVTREAVGRLEEGARAMREEIEREAEDGEGGVVRHLLTSIGEQPFRVDQDLNAGRAGTSYNGAHLAEVTVELVPSEERAVSSGDIARRWREFAGPIPGAVELTFTASLFQAGDDINVQLVGADLEELRAAAADLKDRLAKFPGVSEIRDSFRAGKEEVRLSILPSAEQLGLTLADLARQVRQGFHGEEVQRVQRGRDDIKVMLRYPREQRTALGDLEEMRIRTPSGDEVPFGAVARVERARGVSSIRRVERRRAVNVTADVDGAVTSADAVHATLVDSLLPELMAAHPGVAYTFEGERREQGETLGGLFRGFVLAMITMYALMAIPFRSYAQPLIVLSAVPFGLVGAVAGHVLMGMEMSVLSLCGIIALAGVVVNDNLVLVDYINRRRREGTALADAIRAAGVARFRPILLTSLTTFAGLTPLLLERSVQARFLIPMAVSLAFGVVFATTISLLLVPIGYSILDDVKRLATRLRGSGRGP